MNKLAAIWNRARTDLVISSGRNDEDVFLWEHSVRVAKSSERIARLPMVRKHSLDEAALVAAALYHDAGWVVRLRKGDVDRAEVLVRPVPESHRQQGSTLMEKSLRGLLSAGSLAQALQAVNGLDDRGGKSMEGQVVAEADNLDEFGMLAFWPIIRRGALDGKGVQSVIDTWHRRKEYQFWTARLNESFLFAPVRALARERLARFERTMEEIEEHHLGNDVSTIESA